MYNSWLLDSTLTLNMKKTKMMTSIKAKDIYKIFFINDMHILLV